MSRLIVIDAWSGKDTGELDDFGHAVIKAVMFLGRVVSLKLGFSSLHETVILAEHVDVSP